VVVPPCCCAEPEGAVVAVAVAPKSPPAEPAVVVGAPVVEADVDAAGCDVEAAPSPPNNEGLVAPVLGGCGVEADAPPNREGAAVAVVAAGVALELCPPSENPEKEVDDGAVVVAVVAGCVVPELALAPPRLEKSPPADPAGGVLEAPCPLTLLNKLELVPVCDGALAPLCCPPSPEKRFDGVLDPDEAGGLAPKRFDVVPVPDEAGGLAPKRFDV
jgi:hypothetical protein